MTIATVLTLLFGVLTALLGSVYFFKPQMIVRQSHEIGSPRLLHFALPIAVRYGVLTARQVRCSGVGLLLLSAWFLLVAITAL